MFVRSGQSAVLARKEGGEGGREGCMHSAHCAGSQLDDDGEKKHITSAVPLERFALSVQLMCFLYHDNNILEDL